MKLGVKVLALTTVVLILAIAVAGQSKFNPDGAFFLVGEPPAEFSDFSGIYLNGRRLRRLPSQAMHLNNGKVFHYRSLTVRRDNFRFTTVTSSGVYYTFAGKFLRGGVFAEQDVSDTDPVLEGVLVKYKGGKKVAEAKLKLSYFGGT